MVWPWTRRKPSPATAPAVGRVRLYGNRLGDNDVVPLPGYRRYADVLNDRPLLTPGQAQRSAQPPRRPRHATGEA